MLPNDHIITVFKSCLKIHFSRNEKEPVVDTHSSPVLCVHSDPMPVNATGNQPAPAVNNSIQIAFSNVLPCLPTHTNDTSMSILSHYTTANVVSNHFRETTHTSNK